MYINYLCAAALLLNAACQNTGKPATPAAEATARSPIDGAWELVENRVDGKLVNPKRPQQLKIFHDGFFSFMHLDPDGSFHGSGAGTYTLDGNRYRETFRYYSDTTWVDYADEQTWELRGDTLLFAGFKKVFDRSGKQMPADAWGGDKFEEKRVRAKP
ncbi:hypothetical protein [Spirosoma montaniterrae]|uniref:Lipocalin-like domain-containing protein n=1 Tax=Spirosoma montaniterrae TaxID=1178516 RepID=A0A1P9WT40_9BACT|nr:hypothetical protein [Spirosoma montaniterrae]AQG78532.1 hypothetical protein AWR27_03760 [Spirosoma montaniterrae]